MLYNFSRKIDDADVDTEPFIDMSMRSSMSRTGSQRGDGLVFSHTFEKGVRDGSL